MTTKNNCFFCIDDSRTAGSKLTKIPIGFGAGSNSTSQIDDELEATQGFHLFCHLLSINPRPLAHVLKNKCLWACEACAAQLASLRNFVGVYNKVKLEIDHCVSKIRGDICHKLSAADVEEGEEAILPDGSEADEIALNSFRKEFGIEDDDSGDINWNLLSKDALFRQNLYPVVNFLSVATTIVKEEPMEPAEPVSPGASSFLPQSPMFYANPKYEDDGDDGEMIEQDDAEVDTDYVPRRVSTRNRKQSGSRARTGAGAGATPKSRTYQPTACDECGKTFTRLTGLKNHLRNKHGIGGQQERKFKCNDCGKAFLQQHHLTYHAQIHSGDRFFGCQFCDKKFTSQSRRRSHEQSQHGPNGELLKKENTPKPKPQDPVKCTQCPLVFRNEAQRKRHELLIHQKKEFYTCDQCIAKGQDPPAQFKSIYNLWKHQKAEHIGKGKWTCEFCGPTGKTFYSYGKMQLHVKARHGIEDDEDKNKDNPGNSENEFAGEMEIPQSLDFSDLQKLELETKTPENEPSTSTSSSISGRPQRKSTQRIQKSSNTGSESETEPDGASGTDDDDDDYNEEEEKSDPDFSEPKRKNSMPKNESDAGADATGESGEKLVYTPNRRGRRPADPTPLAPGEKRKRKLPERNVPCPNCPRLFRNANRVQEHYHNIHARGYIQCEIVHCDRGFPNQEALDKHMLRHQLNSHKKSLIESGIPKPRRKLPRPEPLPREPKERVRPAPPLKHKCDYCDKMFPWECDKVRHENWVHKNIKSYLCEGCGKAFKRSFQLWHHMRNVHKEHCYKEPVECDQCPPGGKKYSSVGWLEIHLRKYHGKEPPPPKHSYYYV